MVIGKRINLYCIHFCLLTDNPTDEQRSEFLAEIELMKKIGQHPNVLSFLGCWTTTKPLLLVIEYVPHGDLRRWLISKRRKVKSYRSDCQNNYSWKRKVQCVASVTTIFTEVYFQCILHDLEGRVE